MKPVLAAEKQTSARRWRILFIAPSDTGLRIAPELDAMRRQGLDVVSLEGIVTAERVFEFANSGMYDIVHFACHTVELEDEQRIMLSGAEFLSAGDVMQVAKRAGQCWFTSMPVPRP